MAKDVSRGIEFGLKIIKEFEGLSLTAYPDVIEGWKIPTIGYGTTVYRSGVGVHRNDTITQEIAEDELRSFVITKILRKLKNIPQFGDMHYMMQGALISFAYNLGSGFYSAEGFDTISRKLREGLWKEVGEAFKLYVNKGSPAEAGLRRRRYREASVWNAGFGELTMYACKSSSVGISALKIREGVYSMKIKLDVPYYSQRDSKVPGQWSRSCYSSANAMLLSFLKPSALPDGTNADDVYLKKVMEYGDSTDVVAQMRALKFFGIEARLTQDFSMDGLCRQLNLGRPIPIGILHKGPVSAPSGGGHWIIVVGHTIDVSQFYVHDPFGELDLVNGGYADVSGKFLKYSAKNLMPRWMVDGPATGWAINVTKVL